MSNSANSAPAFTQSWGRPGVKNSNTIAPNACPPAASVAFTGLSRIVIASTGVHGATALASIPYRSSAGATAQLRERLPAATARAAPQR